MDAGLAYAGDPDWLYDMPRGKRVRTMGYLLARKEKTAGLWSASGVQAVDLVHLLAQVTTGRGGAQKNQMDALLGQLWDEDGG